ncbi:MAG: PadR family transcriptional regulator [Candidatus Marsarchaeota archaeon]|nr:PadR family transcriptional regulator [Candidatus Marsarchaeota archaeon]
MQPEKARKNGFMNKEMRRMIIKLVLLSKLKAKKCYTYELISMVGSSGKAHAFGIEKPELKNDIYNTMHALEKSGYIKLSESKNSSNKRYYEITPEGRAALQKSKGLMIRYMRELVKIIR